MDFPLPMHLPGGTIMTRGPDVHPKRARALTFVVVWAILLSLAGLKVVTAFVGIGVWAPIIQFGIVAIEVAAVFAFFMRLKGSPSLKLVFAVSGFFWLCFLFGLSMTDYADRQGWPPLYAPNGPSFQVPHSVPGPDRVD
jgi:caa(3)-type oxidase subunit IV